jgi:hypothetical protein
VSQSSPDPAALRQALVASPALCPLEWNGDRTAVLFAKLSEADYQAASFLDRRAMQPGAPTGGVPWSLAEPWLVGLPRRCNFIFHISHCGSTLLSRLIGTAPDVFSVREPGILRGLDLADSEARIDAVLGLLSRVFQPAARPLVKATSVVNAVADRLMARACESRAILIGLPAETFLAAVLDGSRSDIESHAADRFARLVRLGRVKPEATATGLGEHAAAAWACEMATLASLATSHPRRTRWIDFDRFLAEPVAHLGAALTFLGYEADAATILTGPLMHRYAKKTEAAYDSDLRTSLLTVSRERHAHEIAAGLDWLDHHGLHDLATGATP